MYNRYSLQNAQGQFKPLYPVTNPRTGELLLADPDEWGGPCYTLLAIKRLVDQGKALDHQKLQEEVPGRSTSPGTTVLQASAVPV